MSHLETGGGGFLPPLMASYRDNPCTLVSWLALWVQEPIVEKQRDLVPSQREAAVSETVCLSGRWS